MRHVPVVIEVYPGDLAKADLLRELKIDKTRLDHELLRQPGLYAWWASLYSKVAEKAARLQDRLDYLEAKKFIQLSRVLRRRGKMSATEIKQHVSMLPSIMSLRKKVRTWENAERILKYAERSFQQRKDVLQTYCANQRREEDSEPRTKRRRHSEEEDDE